MNTRKSWFTAAALLAALTLGGCASPVSPPGTADAALLHRVDTVMRQAVPAVSVSLRLSSEQVTTGAAISAEVGSNAEGYVYLFQLGTDGRTLSLVFPNAMDGANHIPAGTKLMLPRPNWRMSARGPAGVGHLLAVVSDKPLDLIVLQSNAQQGKLEVASRYGAAMATLREVAP